MTTIRAKEKCQLRREEQRNNTSKPNLFSNITKMDNPRGTWPGQPEEHVTFDLRS